MTGDVIRSNFIKLCKRDARASARQEMPQNQALARQEVCVPSKKRKKYMVYTSLSLPPLLLLPRPPPRAVMAVEELLGMEQAQHLRPG